MPVIDTNALIDNRVKAIRDYHDRYNISKGQLDISGGIDSAVMAMLLVKALGPENCIFDHTVMKTNLHQTDRARELCKALKVPMAIGHFTNIFDNIFDEIIGSMLEAYQDADWVEADTAKKVYEDIEERLEADPTIKGSIRSTLRAPLGRAYNRIMGGGIRHGTGNECEDRFLRFYQKGGDGEVDTNPLAMLSKTEVYQLAYALGHQMGIYEVVRPIIEATPSPDLWGNGDAHSDENELLRWTGVPFTYGRIDPDTGEIISIGTIERVSRFLDIEFNGSRSLTVNGQQQYERVGYCLFRDDPYWDDVHKVAHAQRGGGIWAGFSIESVMEFLEAARKAHFQTRHKENSFIPKLGSRKELVRGGILTDTFPEVRK